MTKLYFNQKMLGTASHHHLSYARNTSVSAVNIYKKIDQLAVQIKYTKAFHYYIVCTKYGLSVPPQFSHACDMALQGIWPDMK
jgi:hypothetical protein